MIAEHAHVFVVDKRWDWDEKPDYVEVSLLTGGGPLSEIVRMSSEYFGRKLTECGGRAVVVINRKGVGQLKEDNNFGNDKSYVTKMNDDTYKGRYRQILFPGTSIPDCSVVPIGLITGDSGFDFRHVSVPGFDAVSFVHPDGTSISVNGKRNPDMFDMILHNPSMIDMMADNIRKREDAKR